MKYSIIIPYQHSTEREPLLLACLERLLTLSQQFEICVHEVGPDRKIILPTKCKHLFTCYKGVFHRAWAINRGVRELATGDMLILMDGDLIIDQNWVNEVIKIKELSVGWGKIHNLTPQGTKTFLKTKYINSKQIEKTKTPSMGGAAGGITVIPTKLFYEMQGIPEDFYGSWGGEDNAFWSKLVTFDYKFSVMQSEIYHLNHSPSTPRVKDIQHKVFPIMYWNKSQWKEYDRLIDSHWGVENPDIWILPSTEYISSIKGPKLTLAMLSWLRYDKLINTLTNLAETLTIPINLTLMVQGSEKLNAKQKDKIRELANNFDSYDLFFTQGNIGTGPARKQLLARSMKRFHTPYINLADDDTTYSKESVEAVIDYLENNPDVGVAGIRYKEKVYKLNSTFNPTTFNIVNASNTVEIVDSTGSASAFIRREVFDLCSIDSTYIIGEWDIDLFMQARSVGWKIVNLQLSDSMKAINDWGGNAEYKSMRLNRKEIKKSVKRFKQKWGLDRAL